MYSRICKPLESNSFFLFGPRGSGKTSLLKDNFSHKNCLWLDLLDDELAQEYLLRPKLLWERLNKSLHTQDKYDWVIIDEIQKVPALLDIVHMAIEEKKQKFALTGSSARKLKRGAANLLAGRAFVNHLHPLTSVELKDDFDLQKILKWGSLPKIFSLDNDLERSEFLKSYVNTFLKEEIKEEQLVRKMTPFVKFLGVAAQANGTVLNMSKIARDSGTDPSAVERYFEILIDTMIGYYLEPFHFSVRKRQSQKSKFYFFDLGVQRALSRTLSVDLVPGTYPYGNAFEHFLILELIRLRDYHRKDYEFSYLRTKDDLEIDLIIERPGLPRILLEIKSSESVDNVEIEKLKKIKMDLQPCELWVASREKQLRSNGFAEIGPWQEFVKRLYP